MPAPPTIPVISFTSPVFGDTMLTEAHNTELGAYRELPIGTPHPDAGKYPGYILVHQQPFAGDEKWIQRFWTADKVLPETFNLKSRTYDGEDITKDIYERNYVYRRKDYEPATKLVNFKGVLYVRMLLAGSGYDNTATVAFSGGGGSTQATGVPIVFRGSIYGVRLTSEGAGYTSAPTPTFSAPVSGVTATGTAVIQNPLAVLTDERADRMEGDPNDGVYLKITRIYRVLPGAILYKYVYDEQKGAVNRSSQLVAATGNEEGSVTIDTLTGKIADIRIDNNGAGYTSTPTINFSGPAGPSATAVLSSRQIATLPISNAGSGYITAPLVTIIGGGGTGASATAVLAGSAVSTVTLASLGSGYSGALTVRFTGTGTGAAATATYGVTTASFTVNPNTRRYFSTPTLTFGPGTGATGTVLLGVSSESFVFTTPGTNRYSVFPLVTITGGTGATANPLMGVSAQSFTITSGTTTYSAAPTVTITGGGLGLATATATLDGAGLVTGITITAPGYGFIAAPSIAFTGGTVLAAGTNPSGTGNTLNFIAVGAEVLLRGTGFSFSSSPTIVFSGGTLTFTGTTTVASGNTTNFLVVGVTVTSSGSGFTSVAPTLVFGGGGITTAGVAPEATGNGTNFLVATVSKTASGTGYTTAPSAIFVSTTGTGAATTVTLSPTSVASLTITSSGDDFTSVPTVTIGNPASGSDIALCASPTITTAIVDDIIINSAGTGYTEATIPNITFSGGGPSTSATATAVIGANVIETRYDEVSTVVLRKIVEKWILPGPTVYAAVKFEQDSGAQINERKTLRKTSDITTYELVVGTSLRIVERERSGISTAISMQVVTSYARAAHYSLGSAVASTFAGPYTFPGRANIYIDDVASGQYSLRTFMPFGVLKGYTPAFSQVVTHYRSTFWVNAVTAPSVTVVEPIGQTFAIGSQNFTNILTDAFILYINFSNNPSFPIPYAATVPSFSEYTGIGFNPWIGTLRIIDYNVTQLRNNRWKVVIDSIFMR